MKPYQLETGAEIDGFRIGKKLHQGGMASVWEVTRPDIDFPIIMKVPIILDGDDAASIVGFEMEQMILPQLHGPHVPRFVAQGDFTAQPYVVMERIEGRSLLPKIAHVPLPADEVADYGIRIATALADLHRQRVQHLDLKPSNLMLRPSGEVVFIDFGLSRCDYLPDLLQEEFRLPMGTGPYIAPEQLAHVRSDPRSDIFALGVLLYFFATGTRPFGNPQGSGALRRRLWQDPAPPRLLKKDIPKYLQEVILHCLEIEADDRYQNAAAIAFDLLHPDQLQLTARAERTTRHSFVTRWKRWAKAVGWEPKPLTAEAPAQSAPIILAAVDLSPGQEPLAEAIRAMAARLVKTMPRARLACVNILRTHRIGVDYVIDEQGRNIHVTRLVALKGWAQSLKLDTMRMTFHVLEAPDPAAALIDFAKTNHVDQIIIGARGSSTLRRYVGSVSAQVVAEAPCTVIVVRIPG